jgi:hypothetical protein
MFVIDWRRVVERKIGQALAKKTIGDVYGHVAL